jgi:uncharacterized protein (DUF1778 family)
MLINTEQFRTFVKKYEIMGTLKQDKARFDTRLPLEQKQLFEKAAKLGGYRNLTDFVIVTVQTKAKEIIEERERIIASQKDKEIFFDSLLNPPKPNKDLLSARDEYKELTAK